MPDDLLTTVKADEPEEWRHFGTEAYEVSSHGNVRTWIARGNRKGLVRSLDSPALLPQHDRNKGFYWSVAINDGERRRMVTVHHLVAEAFLHPKPAGRYEVAHLDGNGKNNHASNLAWVTHSENERMKRHHGTAYTRERNHASKLSPEDVAYATKAHAERTETIKQLAERFGVWESTIWDALAGGRSGRRRTALQRDEQIADLTTRLEQAEAERDAAQKECDVAANAQGPLVTEIERVNLLLLEAERKIVRLTKNDEHASMDIHHYEGRAHRAEDALAVLRERHDLAVLMAWHEGAKWGEAHPLSLCTDRNAAWHVSKAKAALEAKTNGNGVSHE